MRCSKPGVDLLDIHYHGECGAPWPHAHLADAVRAKTRIARQRIEVNLPLGKIVNARKELFSELKTFSNLVPSSATIDHSPPSGSRPTASSYSRRVGRGTQRCGTCRT